jgi:hypothetical protein
VFRKAGLESIESFKQKRTAQVAKHLSPESKATTDIANSLDIEVNMEKVCWLINLPKFDSLVVR